MIFDYYVEKSIYSEVDRKVRAEFIEKFKELWKNLDFESIMVIEDRMGVSQSVNKDEFYYDKLALDYLNRLITLLKSYQGKCFIAGSLLLKIIELRDSSHSYKDKEAKKYLEDNFFEIECLINTKEEKEMEDLMVLINLKEEKYLKKSLE